MRRRQSSIKLAALKALLSLFLCSFLILTTKQIFGELDLEITIYSIMRQYQEGSGGPFAYPSASCTLTKRLGLPKYVADRCQPEDHLPCSNLTCANLLFSGENSSIYSTAREFMKLHDFPRLLDADFVNMTRNCSSFRLERGYEQKMKNDYEDFPIAFNLIVHEDVEQIERLIYALYRPKNRFCIHLDLKSSTVMQEAMEGISRCLPNVFMPSKRIAVYWGEFSRLEADINCMRDHVEKREDWTYLINSAGMAFPIRSMREMVEILKIYNGANDIEGMIRDRIKRHRFEYEFDRGSGDMIVMKEPKIRHPDPPFDLDIVRGSAYGIFSRGFVEYIVNDSRAKEFLEWSRGTFSPDEFYWATLHHTFTNPHFHPPGGYAGDPNTKPWLAVYVNWLEEPCFGHQRHGICVFGVEDLPRLMSRKEFFVNKFQSGVEPMALECLRTWIDYKESCTGLQQLDIGFYKGLPFVKKSSSQN